MIVGTIAMDKFYGVRKRGYNAIYNSLDFDKSFDKWILLGARKFEIFCYDLLTGEELWAI